MQFSQLTNLIGRILQKIEVNDDRDRLTMITVEGTKIIFFHEEECCESVAINDIVGDLNDLIGAPILVAEVVVHEQDNPEGVSVPAYQDSWTWTFYKFATMKGYVDVRWYGASNGYYSERVSIIVE